MARLMGQESRDSQCLANFMDIALELLSALQRNDIKSFERLLDDAEPLEINKRHDYPHYRTCVELACKNGQADFLALLIKHEAEVNSYNAVRKTRPLHMACTNGQHECVQLLLTYGADVNARDGHGRQTPLHVLMSTWEESKDTPTTRFPTLPSSKEAKFAKCFQLLLDHPDVSLDVENDDECSPLELAIRQQNGFATKILLDHGAPVTENVREAIEELEEFMPQLEKWIEEASTQDNIPSREININDQIWKAIRHNDHKQLKLLLERLPSPSSVKLDDTTQSLTYIQHCSREGLPECLDLLLKAGGNPNLSSFSEPRQPIILAAYNGHFSILKRLCEHSITDVNVCDSTDSKQTALHKIVLRLNQNPVQYMKCLTMLLDSEKQQMNIDSSDIAGNTALHYAVQTGVEEAVLLLLRQGASLGLKNVLGETPVTNMLPTTLETFLDECIVQNRKDGRAARDYHITFNYSFLASKAPLQRTDSVNGLEIVSKAKYSDVKENITFMTDTESTQDQTLTIAKPMRMDNYFPESEALWYLSRSSRHQYLLRHPVVTSFLLLKWHKIRNYFYINLGLYLLTVLLLTFYVLIREQSIGLDHPNASKVALSVLWYVLAFFVALLFIREFFQFGIAPLRYLCSLENYFELGMLIATAIVLQYSNEPESVQHFSALAVLLAWAEFLLMIGRHPRLSIFVATFLSVTLSFFKLLLWYSILIFGFALSFHLIFKKPTSNNTDESPANGTTSEPAEDNKNENFQTLPLTILKIIAMMTGELEFSDLPFHMSPVTSRFIFLTFVFLITVVLLNLLNGLAVSDTQTIQSKAEVISYSSLIDLVSYMESMLLGDPFHFLSNYPPFRWLRRIPDANCCRSFLRMPSLRPCMQRYSTLLFTKCLPNKVYTVYPNRRGSQRPNQNVIGIPACQCHRKFSLPYENIEAACTRLQEMENSQESNSSNFQNLDDKLEDLRKTVKLLSENQEQIMRLLQNTLTPNTA